MQPNSNPEFEYGFTVGDRVEHKREASLRGKIVRIDCNLPSVTTCEVEWDGYPGERDIQWTNKLTLSEEE